MEYGITQISIITVKSMPTHTSETLTQLLFGELYTIEEKHENWYRIVVHNDNYSGWIPENQNTHITEATFKQLTTENSSCSAELIYMVSANDKTFPILIGSTLYNHDGINFKIGKDKYLFNGQSVKPNSEFLTDEHIRKFAMNFLHAPYLWGGRSPFGIDCSGFTQVVYKIYGINMPRDAYQQAAIGKTINFIHEAKEGDLAFFGDEQGKITHVGIILNDMQIIHASGKVRIDTIDHYGIFNKSLKKYTHKLRVIKRVR